MQGNFIGTDVTGTLALPNGSYGILVESAGNLIGGTNSANANVISGNGDNGLYLLNANNNVVEGNLIGVSVTGENQLGNANNGILIYGGAANSIGGAASGTGNTISGNGVSGIYLYTSAATGNLIQGNRIGTDPGGAKAMGNQGGDGITMVNAPANTISSNVISANAFAGVSISGASTGNFLLGNHIGTDGSGTIALSNGLAGVTVFSGASSNHNGGSSSGQGNQISRNGQDGSFFTGGATGNLIQAAI